MAFAKNVSYIFKSRRLSVMELLSAIITKFDRPELCTGGGAADGPFGVGGGTKTAQGANWIIMDRDTAFVHMFVLATGHSTNNVSVFLLTHSRNCVCKCLRAPRCPAWRVLHSQFEAVISWMSHAKYCLHPFA